MKTLILSFLTVLGLVACSPSELAKFESEDGYIVVFDKQCSNAGILQMFSEMGAPQEILDTLKAGEAHNAKEKVTVELCATEQGPMGPFPDSYFIVDEDGRNGYFNFKPVQPMKHDNPLPGKMGT
jgi:hypothetical protein